jgi:hypothetical protein
MRVLDLWDGTALTRLTVERWNADRTFTPLVVDDYDATPPPNVLVGATALTGGGVLVAVGRSGTARSIVLSGGGVLAATGRSGGTAAALTGGGTLTGSGSASGGGLGNTPLGTGPLGA